LPRPGTNVPTELASDKEVSKYSTFTPLFFKKIIDLDYEAVFISDESSIWDFVFEDNLENYYKKIKDVYNVDVSDTDGNFLKIFQKIFKNGFEPNAGEKEIYQKNKQTSLLHF
jgi:hypothetical protein